MNKLLIAVVAAAAFTMASPVFAGCEGFDQDMAALEQIVHVSTNSTSANFGREFPSAEALQRWTETSTRGGGHIEERSMDGRDFIFSFRSYTSGVKSSDAAVYIDDNGTWRLVKAYPALMGSWIVAERQDDTYLFHPEHDSKSLMVLSRDDYAGL